MQYLFEAYNINIQNVHIYMYSHSLVLFIHLINYIIKMHKCCRRDDCLVMESTNKGHISRYTLAACAFDFWRVPQKLIHYSVPVMYILIWCCNHLRNISKKHWWITWVPLESPAKIYSVMNISLGIYLSRVPNLSWFPIMQDIPNHLYGKWIGNCGRT